jgi:hypothetical protein
MTSVTRSRSARSIRSVSSCGNRLRVHPGETQLPLRSCCCRVHPRCISGRCTHRAPDSSSRRWQQSFLFTRHGGARLFLELLNGSLCAQPLPAAATHFAPHRGAGAQELGARLQEPAASRVESGERKNRKTDGPDFRGTVGRCPCVLDDKYRIGSQAQVRRIRNGLSWRAYPLHHA